MRQHIPLRCGMLLAIFALCITSQLHGQSPQPVVLVHGLMSNGSTWASAAARLESEFDVVATTPNLLAGQPYMDQANNLAGQTWGLADSTILIGHSNGGVISRQATLWRPYGAVVTAGTPHEGAGLAQFTVDGNMANFASDVANWVMFAMLGISLEYGGGYWYWWMDEIQAAVGVAAIYLDYEIDQIAQEFINETPVLYDMVPGSTFLSGINSSYNLTREAAAFQRFGIRVEAEAAVETGFLRYLNDAGSAYAYRDLTDAAGATLQLLGPYWESSISWSDPWWYEKMQAAQSTYILGLVLSQIPLWWCNFIGAYDPQLQGCFLNDVVVPNFSQTYPGSGAVQRLVQGPNHVEITGNGDVHDMLVDILRIDLNVAPAP